MAQGMIFNGFEEPKIAFLPTFKFDLNSSYYDTSEKQRVPSYTVGDFLKANLFSQCFNKYL